MKERPIIFSGAMVRAILDGTKTQTRRVIRLGRGVSILGDGNLAQRDDHRCPYGEPGDRLWVKERICLDSIGDVYSSSYYYADGEMTKADAWPWKRSSLPSIHMPKGLSRITLELTDVRVQRVQSISEEDARAEGIREVTKDGVVRKFCIYDLKDRSSTPWVDMPREPVLAFAALWDSINLDRAPWAANPWVWALTFKRVTP